MNKHTWKYDDVALQNVNCEHPLDKISIEVHHSIIWK